MARTQTVQATGKGWKLLAATGMVGMIGGLVLYFMAGPDAALQRTGGVGAAIGLVVWMYGRAGAWWFHG